MRKSKDQKKKKNIKNQDFKIYFFKNKVFRYVLTPKLFNFKIIGSIAIPKNSMLELGKTNYFIEISISEILKTFDNYYRLYKLKISDIKYNQLHTNLEGYRVTNDKLFSLLIKSYSTIELNLKIKTKCGANFIIFSLFTTDKYFHSNRKGFYGKKSSIKKARKYCKQIIYEKLNNQSIDYLFNNIYTNYYQLKLTHFTKNFLPVANFYIIKIKKLH
uniref:Ribosomal protein S3a n=1 Tax=Lotharella vacuolata TaxID=74820 RepID=A0A0H5BH72_9EUKA|nr:ribosomal protein S3a [Lotharella vacuolata]